MRRFQDGFLRIGRLRGVPIRIHWATPIGALLLARFEFRPLTWALFAALVLLHELAHAAAARAVGVPVYSADLMPYGGQCVHGVPRSQLGVSLIAAAGPAVHVVLFAVAMVLLRTDLLRNAPAPVRGAVDTIGVANFFLAALNLLPIRPLDGAEAWKLAGIGVTSAWNRTASAVERAQLAWRHWRLERRARRAGLRWTALEGEDAGEREDERPRRRLN